MLQLTLLEGGVCTWVGWGGSFLQPAEQTLPVAWGGPRKEQTCTWASFHPFCKAKQNPCCHGKRCTLRRCGGAEPSGQKQSEFRSGLKSREKAGQAGETFHVVQDAQQGPKLQAGVGPPNPSHNSPWLPTSSGTEGPNGLPPRQATGLGNEWTEPPRRRLWASAERTPKGPAASSVF